MTLYLGLQKGNPIWDTAQTILTAVGQYLNLPMQAHSGVGYDIKDYVFQHGTFPTGVSYDNTTDAVKGFTFAGGLPEWQTDPSLGSYRRGDTVNLALRGKSYGVIDLSSDSTPVDPSFSSVNLLMHLDELNASATSFYDAVGNYYTLMNGASIAPNTGRFGQAASFNGTNQYISIQPTKSFDFTDFTIEYWEYRTDSTDSRSAIARSSTTTSGYTSFLCGYKAGANLQFYATTAQGGPWNLANSQSMGPCILNAWTHYAVTRQGTTWRTFQNGIQQATWTQAGTLYPMGNAPLSIGNYSNSYFFKGLIDEVRLSTVCRYSANFQVSTSLFPNTGTVYKTSLLTEFSSPITDRALNHVIDTHGSVSFSTSDGISGATSGIFDGASWLTSPYTSDFDLTAKDFTIELSAKPTEMRNCTVVSQGFSQNNYGPFKIGIQDGRWRMMSSLGLAWDYINVDMGAVDLNQWQHLALTREGTNWRVFKNGILASTVVASANPIVVPSESHGSALSQLTTSIPTWTTTTTSYVIQKNTPSNIQFLASDPNGLAISYYTIGTLPDGMNMDSSGVLSGSPTITTTYSFSIRAMNTLGIYVDKSFSVQVLDQAAVQSSSPGVVVDFVTKKATCGFVNQQQTITLNIDTTLTIKCWGAGGGCGGTGWGVNVQGGNGGYVSATFNILAGQPLTIYVGGGGVSESFGHAFGGGGYGNDTNYSGVYQAAGGGGYSGVFLGSVSQATALVIAGGGGGGGGGQGGHGGGASGADGTSYYGSNTGGHGGTLNAGGAFSNVYGALPGVGYGTALQGGDGAYCGGGGGGGYWGGGSTNYGGGGGGSGFIAADSSNKVSTVGGGKAGGQSYNATGSNGYVEISW